MVEPTSYQIIDECRKRHGDGSLFFRTDGLQREDRRAALRQRFLEANPDIGTHHRGAILKAAVTPGMNRGEATAAWGLLDEDTRNVFGHVTREGGVTYADGNLSAGGQVTYAYFTGFDVGRRYALYMIDDVVTGVRETQELIAPHEREPDMRLAERYLDLFCFFEGIGGEIIGTDMAEFLIPPDVLPIPRREAVPRFMADEAAMRDLEMRLVGHGVYSAYLEALRRMGTDVDKATPGQRCEAALAVKPMPNIPWLFSMP